MSEKLDMPIGTDSIIIDQAINGYLVRVLNVPDLKNPARDNIRVYVCNNLDEVIKLIKSVFEK